MTLYLGDNLISGTQTIVGESRNIGQIIPSAIPLTDAGLHLLDGTLINGSGIYSAFVTYISGLVSTYPDLFVTEADWQTSVNTYGVCGKFVYDSVNNTVRLPKYNSKIYTGGGTAPVIGTGMTLGLTDGTNFGAFYENTSNDFSSRQSGYGINVGTSVTGSNSFLDNRFLGVTSDPTKSGIIADLSDITTSLEGYYYIVIATSTKTDIQVDIDEVVTDLNGKADVDLSNMNPSQTAKDTIIGWGMPDYSAGENRSWATSYKENVDGYAYVKGQGTTSSSCYDIQISFDNTNWTSISSVYISGNGSNAAGFIPIPKDVYWKVTAGGGGHLSCKFYPKKGAN